MENEISNMKKELSLLTQLNKTAFNDSKALTTNE